MNHQSFWSTVALCGESNVVAGHMWNPPQKTNKNKTKQTNEQKTTKQTKTKTKKQQQKNKNKTKIKQTKQQPGECIHVLAAIILVQREGN